MKKPLLAITVIASIVLYHNGVDAENKCLSLGNTAEQCAQLGM